MAVTAADVPSRYDLVIDLGGGNVTGFKFADARISPIAADVKANYGYSQTFVDRQNVSGDYGDNQQDFWLTWSQRDWSGGEGRRYYRKQSANEFFKGTSTNVSREGEVTVRPNIGSITFAAGVRACYAFASFDVSSQIAALSTTNLYTVDGAGNITDKGAHGLGATPSPAGITTDGTDLYFSTTTAGTVGVRKYNGAAFSTFSATSADSLAYLNNTLYGLRNGASGTQELGRYSTAGVYTALFTWQQADGGTGGLYSTNASVRMQPMGGKLYITWAAGAESGAELWVYDGNGTSQLAQLPVNFIPHDVEALNGALFISGIHFKFSGNTSTFQTRPAIQYYASGQLGQLWQAEKYAPANSNASKFRTAVCAYDGGLVFNDESQSFLASSRLMFYDPASGAISDLGQMTTGSTGDTQLLAANSCHVLCTRNGADANFYPDLSGNKTGFNLYTSQVDFDSSLSKYFRSIRVDFDSATDGNGGQVSVAYYVNSFEATAGFVNGFLPITSGVEYNINATGRSIGIDVFCERLTSTDGPRVKRITLKAVPLTPTYRLAAYSIDCSGTPEAPQRLRDGSPNPKTGRQLADALRSAFTFGVATFTDRFGTYTGVIEPSFQLQELHATDDGGGASPAQSGTFYANLQVREV